MGVFLLLLALVLYFLPSLIGQKKRNANSIFIVNLFLGWTLVGWVIALAWAVAAEAPAPVTSPTPVIAPVSRIPYLCNQCGKYSEPVGLFCPLCGVKKPPLIPRLADFSS
jgi:Superinfection immunity protein